jgi:hypothetical protein
MLVPSISHFGGIDELMGSADQRGHGIGVSLDVYTRASIQRKAEGAQQLEDAVLGQKVVPIREKVA